MIGIIDYGSGNLRSVVNAFRYLGQETKVYENADNLDQAEKIVLPGVGSSKDAMQGLEERGFIRPLLDDIKKGKPFLGICLGLQLLFEQSSETGGCGCLGLFSGEVKLFNGDKKFKIPQIGWNTVRVVNPDCPLFNGIKDNTYFYFVHSYYCDVTDKNIMCGETDYTIKYASAVWKDNVYAVQFHPERSQKNGIKMLENFVKL
ncbi:MAG: imidazole glycerol phosphate synthase subunit HisH [Candidatus Omnitrophota bacterium]